MADDRLDHESAAATREDLTATLPGKPAMANPCGNPDCRCTCVYHNHAGDAMACGLVRDCVVHDSCPEPPEEALDE